ncbi:MAG: metallophosphoesterase family protein, partial [Defluviitaleaceae bacterium]|nr:metallophosphoesterase family protein [Defluviitaleaceae bacterium]
ERFLAISPCVDSGEEAVAKILLTHGNKLGVKVGIDRLAYYAREKGANAIFYGHTHFPICVTVGGILVLNPGSPSFPRGGSLASYAIVEILPDGEISGKLLQV